MAIKSKTEKPVDTPTGAIIYTDGGSRANYGGYGMHGYIYSDQKPTKGSGNPTQYLTNLGYVPKTEIKDKADLQEVKPLHYINGYSSFNEPVTNNIAEMAGTLSALDYGIRHDLKHVTIFTDSEILVKGANTWLASWKKNNWIKSDGQPVANRSLWESIDTHMGILKDKGSNVSIKWLKGHSTHLGNQLADKLATIGVMHSKENNIRTELSTEKAEGYWSNAFDKNPFITQKRIYFTTRAETTVPGEYYLGDHGKDDDLLGKRTADGCYSYIVLKEPEPAIELMRLKQIKLSGYLDIIVMARLDKLFEPSTYTDILNYGDICFYTKHRDKLDMYFLDNEPVSRELRPPRLAMRAIDQVNILKGIFKAYKENNDPNLVQTDITNTIYNIDAEGTYKLKPEFVVGFTTLGLEVNYGKVENVLKNKIDLCMSVDLPERNYLKRMEKMKPSVKVITWMESDKMFRYVTIIEADGNSGIWGGMYSNSKFI